MHPWILLLSVALVLAGGVPADSEDHGAFETEGAHAGMLHVPDDHHGHAHGDADDHHETPDSPCHHHEDHACCSSGPAVAMVAETGTLPEWTGILVSLPPMIDRVEPRVELPFHIPIA